MWELMETGHYKYDPEDKHGPILYYFSSALNKALGIDASDLTQTQVRLLPILASIGLMILVLVGDRKSRGTSLVAAALFALSPFPVIYSAYYVQEILFTLIGFLLLYSANEYWKLPSSMNAARCGLWIGLFFATKETAIIHVAAVGLAVVAIQGNAFEIKAWSERIRLKQILVALGTTAFIWGFFYSAAFSDFSGIVDSFKTFAIYAERSQGAGHEKPFYYYFSIFWPHRAEGIRWGEAPFLILAAIGFFSACQEFEGADATCETQRALRIRLLCTVFYHSLQNTVADAHLLRVVLHGRRFYPGHALQSMAASLGAYHCSRCDLFRPV